MQVWIGRLEVTQIPGATLIQLSQGAAFTWFTCWAESRSTFVAKARDVMEYYGLILIEADQISPAQDQMDISAELQEQIAATAAAETFALYGTFHGYPPRFN